MIKQAFTLALGSFFALNAAAQSIVPDAAWCDVIQQVLYDQGHGSTVRCDVENGRRVLHVMMPTRTYNYNVPERTNLPDFSTPVNIAVEEFEFRSSYRNEYRSGYHGDRRGEYVGDRRAWMGRSNSLYYPDEVYTLPSDIDFLENAVRSTMSRMQRVNLVDYRYAGQQRGEKFYVLRTTVLALQRGESFKEVAGSTPPPQNGGNNPKPGSNGNNGHNAGNNGHNAGNNGRTHNGGGAAPAPVNRKVDRVFACAQLHLELVDTSTGSVVWSQDLSDENYEYSTTRNPMDDVINTICRKLTEQFQRLYPTAAPRASVSGPVVRSLEEKKNKVQTLYIGLGTYQQLRKGDQLPVYVVTNVGGYSGRQQIGTVSVTDIQGPELSVCKVKKGDKEIFNALHSGQSLIVEGPLD